MTKRWIKLAGVILFLLCSLVVFAVGPDLSVEPGQNHRQPWRIGYYEGGPYIDYQQVLIATVHGLMELGWLSQAQILTPPDVSNAEIWAWLATQASNQYLQFVPDAFYSANWDPAIRKTMAPAILDRLNTRRDIDLMLAFGTWAGQDLATNQHHTPTKVLSVSDAVQAGIVASAEDSGLNHVHASVDPIRYDRQIRVFYDIFHFKRLGIPYEDSTEGRSYAALPAVHRMAQKYGFDIVSCGMTGIDEQAEASAVACIETLIAARVDALYITAQQGMTDRSIPEIAARATAAKIPTFAQEGPERVKQGLLLSFAMSDFTQRGRFEAEVLAKILNGAIPRMLPQVFITPPTVAINLTTAKQIGFTPPPYLLEATTEIFP